MVAGRMRSCLVSSCRISHLGKKPESGGRPPKESNVINAMMVSKGDFVVEGVRELILVQLNMLRRRNMGMVMII